MSGIYNRNIQFIIYFCVFTAIIPAASELACIKSILYFFIIRFNNNPDMNLLNLIGKKKCFIPSCCSSVAKAPPAEAIKTLYPNDFKLRATKATYDSAPPIFKRGTNNKIFS